MEYKVKQFSNAPYLLKILSYFVELTYHGAKWQHYYYNTQSALSLKIEKVPNDHLTARFSFVSNVPHKIRLNRQTQTTYLANTVFIWYPNLNLNRKSKLKDVAKF